VDESVLDVSVREFLSTIGVDAAGGKQLIDQWCSFLRAANDAGPYPEEQQPSPELATRYSRATKILRAAAKTSYETETDELHTARSDLVTYQNFKLGAEEAWFKQLHSFITVCSNL
jgi:hypothetical protein